MISEIPGKYMLKSQVKPVKYLSKSTDTHFKYYSKSTHFQFYLGKRKIYIFYVHFLCSMLLNYGNTDIKHQLVSVKRIQKYI